MRSLLILILFCVFVSLTFNSRADLGFTNNNVINSTKILERVQKGDEIIIFDNKIINGNISLNSKLNKGRKCVKSVIMISSALIKGSTNFDNICFTKPIIFNNTTFRDEVNFQNSIFLGGAYFNNAHFCKDVNFKNSSFLGEAYFNDAYFNKSASFGDARFREIAYFKGSNFTEADFSACNFSQDANFGSVNVLNDCDFNDAMLVGKANFSYANFNGDVVFAGTEFRNETYFRYIKYNHIVFNNAHFFGEVYFDGSSYYVIRNNTNPITDFNNAIFNKYCNFSKTYFINANFMSIFQDKVDFIGSNFTGKEAIFSEANFFGYADFSNAIFSTAKQAIFHNTTFYNIADFKDSNFIKNAIFSKANFTNKALFEGTIFGGNANFESAQFGEVGSFQSDFRGDLDLSGSHFRGDGVFRNSKFRGSVRLDNAQFNEDVNFLNSVFLDEASIHLNETKFGKIYLRWEQIQGGLIEDSRLFYNEETFLSLIQNYKSLGWIRDANECNLEYRKKARQSLPIIYRIPDIFLWIFYGYGVKPEWTIFWFISLVTACALFYWKNDENKIEDAIIFSAKVFLSGTGKLLITVPIYNPKSKARLANLVFNLERLIGGLLIFLLFIAITRTVTI